MSITSENDIVQIPIEKSGGDIIVQASELTINEKYMNKGWIDTSDRVEMFNKWAKAEGVVMPKIEYPAYFEDGLVGMKCVQDIDHREIFIYIPYKVLISVKDTKSHPILKQIIEENPEMFVEDTD